MQCFKCQLRFDVGKSSGCGSLWGQGAYFCPLYREALLGIRIEGCCIHFHLGASRSLSECHVPGDA